MQNLFNALQQEHCIYIRALFVLYLLTGVLNHQSEDATRIYAHLSDNCVKTALEKHGEKIKPMLDSLLKQSESDLLP